MRRFLPFIAEVFKWNKSCTDCIEGELVLFPLTTETHPAYHAGGESNYV